MRGKVKRFGHLRKYGFITDENGNDIFVHYTEILGAPSLAIGQEVEFDVKQTDKGPEAVNVRVLSASDVG